MGSTAPASNDNGVLLFEQWSKRTGISASWRSVSAAEAVRFPTRRVFHSGRRQFGATCTGVSTEADRSKGGDVGVPALRQVWVAGVGGAAGQPRRAVVCWRH